MTEVFDAIVIGAGAMGSAAAYYLSERGQRVLLLEQFELDHRMGSSYGHSRIIRYAYDHPEYVELAKDTFPLWFALQDKLGEQAGPSDRRNRLWSRRRSIAGSHDRGDASERPSLRVAHARRG